MMPKRRERGEGNKQKHAISYLAQHLTKGVFVYVGCLQAIRNELNEVNTEQHVNINKKLFS